MKKSNFKITSLITIAFAFALTSCSKDYLNNTGRASDESLVTGTSENITTGPITLSPKLSKHGETTLTYTALLQLSQVSYNANNHTAYSIVNQNGKTSHIATTYYQGNITGRFVYQLNAQGLAASIRAEKLYNGEWQLYWEDTYTYNALKQLIKISSNSGHYDFVYDANGDLSNIKYTNWQNKLIMETIFWYQVGGPFIADKNRINPEDIWVDPYLRIYGKFRNHLPKRIKHSNFNPNGEKTDYKYEYVLDANGYIKTQKKIDALTNVLVETKPFEYIQ
ncbi:hypothetical protein EXU57_03955 [Segetibacter sp. 3557_3]|uniref:hypothetical protein n=1 Tax=Segetibacter sp. 3557_3 TaxID=2547429 RepID=UPI0010590A46|nr:hypothetical protein [Segetibacter sp. 3557_3]TDH29231.1 hypothetical protein EXU57_03955 [Segetibacter sp. 3557_3]